MAFAQKRGPFISVSLSLTFAQERTTPMAEDSKDRNFTVYHAETKESPSFKTGAGEGQAEARARLQAIFGPDAAGAALTKGSIEPVSDMQSTIEKQPERGGPSGPEPTRFGDWERKGRCVDF